MVHQGFFEILMITQISSKTLGGYKIMRNTVVVQISAFSQFGSAYTCFVIIRYNLQIYKEEHGWTTIAVGLFCNSIKNCDDSRKYILTTYFESWRHWTFLSNDIFCRVSDTHFLAKFNDINSHFIKTFYIVQHEFNYFFIISHLCVIQVGR